MNDSKPCNSLHGHGGASLRRWRNTAAAAAVVALMPATASAQAAPASWRYAASVYLYLPSMDGSTSFPTEGNGTPINITAEQILDHLKFAAMGSFDAHNGSWGVFTDAVYLSFGSSKTNSRDFTIGNIGIPANTTANFDSELKGLAWTLAGQYRLPSPDPSLTVDLLGGTRMFNLQERLSWTISGSLGPIDPAARSGRAELKNTLWDAIVGVKGRYVFGGRSQWAVPFYLDVGTGESDSTLQAAAGISYAFEWGELNALWRYLKYDLKSGNPISDVSFNGPQVGAVFRW